MILDNYLGWKGRKENIKIFRNELYGISNVIIRNSSILANYTNEQITTSSDNTAAIDFTTSCNLQIEGFHVQMFRY